MGCLAAHCAQQSAGEAPGCAGSPLAPMSVSFTKVHAGAASTSGGGGRALGSRPSGEPLGCALSRSTPAAQPLLGQLGHTTREVSSSTTVCMTIVM